MDELAAATWFLQQLFPELGEDRIVIFTLPDKQARFFDAAEAAASYGLSRAADCNVYFGAGLYRKGIEGGRGSASDVGTVTSLWADIDFGQDGHKSKARPPSESDARKILSRIEAKPSIVVHSGHGLHAYWLLSEPLAAHTPEGISGASLARRWSITLGAVARSFGWSIDSVFDLSRVLRLPGTLNHKTEPAVPVRIADGAGEPRRYHWDELDALVVDEHVIDRRTSTVTVDVVALDPQAAVNSRKLDALVANEPRFKRAWERNRPDLKDQSPSGYELALANYAVAAGWSDQEIADLIIHFRARHGLDMSKALRRDYLMRTIAVARSAHNSEQATHEIHRMPATGVAMEGDDPTRRDTLSKLSQVLGVPISGWIQEGREEADYRLVLSTGADICIGPVEAVSNQRVFQNRVYEAAAVWPKTVKRDTWDRVLAILARVVEVRDNPEGGRLGRLETWLLSYLSTVTIYRQVDEIAAIKRNRPYVAEGSLHVQGGDLRRHILYVLNERVEPKELWRCLRAGGFQPTSRYTAGEDQRVGRRYWSIELATAPACLHLPMLLRPREREE
jgi:hypothetical protein